MTPLVSMVNGTLSWPSGTVTTVGMRTRPALLVVSVTLTPPVGAGSNSRTRPVAALPPTTVFGLIESEASHGVTVRTPTAKLPSAEARISTGVSVLTAFGKTEKVAVVAPPGMVSTEVLTSPATEKLAPAGLRIVRVTSKPPAGAASVSVTVPVATLPKPPAIWSGANVTSWMAARPNRSLTKKPSCRTAAVIVGGAVNGLSLRP